MKLHYFPRVAGAFALSLAAGLVGAQTMPAGADRPPPAPWSPSEGGLPAAQQVDGVSYVTGGFGLDESTALKNAIADYSVGMVFSEASGAYVGDVQVRIEGAGNAPSANITASGPYLLLDLPNGSYSATATYQGKALTKRFTVSGKGQRIGFAW